MKKLSLFLFIFLSLNSVPIKFSLDSIEKLGIYTTFAMTSLFLLSNRIVDFNFIYDGYNKASTLQIVQKLSCNIANQCMGGRIFLNNIVQIIKNNKRKPYSNAYSKADYTVLLIGGINALLVFRELCLISNKKVIDTLCSLKNITIPSTYVGKSALYGIIATVSAVLSIIELLIIYTLKIILII